jgi:hypothetical protein
MPYRLWRVALAVTTLGGGAIEATAAPPGAQFRPAAEIVEIAGRFSSSTLVDEFADTLPVPVLRDGKVRLLILYFLAGGPPGKRVFAQPGHAMLLDPASGRVLRFWPCKPEEVGIGPHPAPVEGAGIDPQMDRDTYIRVSDRLLAISPRVWELFAAGRVPREAGDRALVREYWSRLFSITPAEVAPFYTSAAPDFFRWVKAATAP